jgi:tetratricopeptide (TPR) repeat protein
MRRVAVVVALLWCSPLFLAQTKQSQPTPKPPSSGQSPEARPAGSKSGETKPDDPKQDYSQESYVIEQMRTIYRFENDGTGRRELFARVKVQSEAGVQQWGQVVVGYNSANEKIEVPSVRVLKADGSVVTAPADSVQDLSAPIEREAPVYTDYRQKHITVPGLRPGEVLEYNIVTIVHTSLAPNNFWMEHEFQKRGIVLDERLEVNIPKDRAVKLKTKPENEAKIAEENGRRIYRWTSSHLEKEDADEDDNAKKKKKKKRPGDEPEPPAVQMTTFASWEEVGRWYSGLEKDRREPAADVKARAEALTKDAKSEMEKIEALYDFVAKNFRYVSLSLGLGRYQPHAAGDVLHNQYGDCKDKHTLLAALLEAEGIHASSVLINSNRKLDPDVPSPSQFDHVITMVPLEKGEVWMDTTTEVAPFRLLSFNLRKKDALVVPAQGAAHLEETPADTPIPNSQLQEVDGKVNELGKLTARVKFTVRGDPELLMRIIFRRIPNAQWKRLVETITTAGGLPGGEISELNVTDPGATREAFHLDYTVNKTNFFDWSKKKADLELPLSQVGLPDAVDDDALESSPIKLGPPGEFMYRARIELVPQYTARLPLPFSVKRDYGEYQANYKMEDHTLVAERRLAMRLRELPGSRASEYIAFRRTVVADLGQHLSLENSAAGKPTPPANMKADDLNESGRSAMNSGNFPLAIELFRRAVELEPKDKFAWNNLGLAYLAVRNTGKALEAFQKQIEVNPYDEFAYNNLGRAYWVDRKYEEAANAFKKQIEISPLDKFAHSNLGRLYAEWHKYDEAAPELEKAISLRSDDPTLQVSLGDAYLNLGQDDKALAAFDRALEISATPVVWNNIAYQLSLKNAHLDKAQQYAESAVAATSAALRNLSLDQLANRDLALVPSLVAYWDTLGWVYFARGDFDKAEKYVSAAWVLGQHGEVGDHLGQIYEKRGRKDEAIRTYAQAMTSFRPELETKGRLAKLSGGEDKVSALVEKHRSDVQVSRTINLGKVAKKTASADFFVLLAGAPGNVGATVEAVRFISGDESLKGFSEALRTAKYDVKFPDDSPTKILRRGVLGCSTTTGDCSFVLMLPDDVLSPD